MTQVFPLVLQGSLQAYQAVFSDKHLKKKKKEKSHIHSVATS